MNAEQKSHPIASWLQLLRAPNLLTVVGDPVAGYLLAFPLFDPNKFPQVLFAVAASLCFYAVGLIMNDLLDLEEDRRERPRRPLASGAIPVRQAAMVAVLLAIAAFGFSAIGPGRPAKVAVILAAAITGYHLLARSVFLGPLLMGSCRAASLLLGAAWAGPLRDRAVLFGAALLGTYIAAVTLVARNETRGLSSKLLAWLPPLVLLAGVFAADLLHVFGKYYDILFPALLLAGTTIAGVIASRLTFQPNAPVPPAIGGWIAVLLYVQAALCAGSGNGTAGTMCGLALLALWPVCRILGMRFYAS
jgi:4-hydroxybenzoate polyprenyltransferase